MDWNNAVSPGNTASMHPQRSSFLSAMGRSVRYRLLLLPTAPQESSHAPAFALLLLNWPSVSSKLQQAPGSPEPDTVLPTPPYWRKDIRTDSTLLREPPNAPSGLPGSTQLSD